MLRGYGVFDFFRVIDGKPIFLDDYLDRFENSMKGLGLTTDFTRQYLTDHIYELIRLNRHPLLGIKMVCTGGYAFDGYTPTSSNPVSYTHLDVYKRQVKIIFGHL